MLVKYRSFLKVFLIAIILTTIVGQVTILPWWGFIVPVMLTGALAAYLRWNILPFTVGFLAGFAVWFGTSVIMDQAQNGIILSKVAHLIKTNKLVICLASGVIGGILSGLSLYAGYVIVLPDQVYKLNDSTEL